MSITFIPVSPIISSITAATPMKMSFRDGMIKYLFKPL
jgi:hypothetical protein